VRRGDREGNREQVKPVSKGRDAVNAIKTKTSKERIQGVERTKRAERSETGTEWKRGQWILARRALGIIGRITKSEILKKEKRKGKKQKKTEAGQEKRVKRLDV